MKARHLPLAATILIFVLSYVLCTIQFPAMFSTRVIGNLLTDNAFLGIAAVGMTFVILSGGIDLSIGSVIAFTGVFCRAARDHLDPSAGRLRAGADPHDRLRCDHGGDHPLSGNAAFIVTLAGMFLARGMAFVLSIDSIPIRHPFYSTLKSLYIKLPAAVA